MDATNKTVTVKRVNVRYLTVTAMLSAVAYILMFLDFSVPFMPSFIKMDLSELPALIGSFAMGALWCDHLPGKKCTSSVHYIHRRSWRAFEFYSGCGICTAGRASL